VLNGLNEAIVTSRTARGSWRNSMASSIAPWAMPTACAPMPGRDLSSVSIATRNPRFSLPSIALAGMRQSWKCNSRVVEQRIPSFFSLAPKSKPGVPFSTMNAVRPRAPRLRFVEVMTV
jgi:hypothetical protein